MTPSEVVMTAMAGWNVDQADETQVESMLSYFADDATFQMIGFPPEIPSDFKGKEAIRAAYMSWLPLHPRLEVTIEKVEGDTVTATTSYWSDPTQAMGVAPLVGADVYVVHNGRIISEIWTLSEQSQQAFEDAFAATSEQ